MGCKAQTTAIAVAMARICNAADRPTPQMRTARRLVQTILNRMLKKSDALKKPMSTRPKMAENYLVKLLFGLILTRFVDFGI